jgi:hypothetical protein
VLAAPHAAVHGPSAGALRAAMAHCRVISHGGYRTDEGAPRTIPVCGANHAVFFKADLDVDCDGVRTQRCSGQTDPAFQPQTALATSLGDPFDAARTPYVVLPNASPTFSFVRRGVALGDVVAVIRGDRVRYGVYADTGPSSIIGEASYAMARSLGIDPDPRTGGADGGVTYVAFAGARARVRPQESHAVAVRVGERLARAFVRGS